MRRRFIEESSASIWASGLLAAPGRDPGLGGQGGAVSCLDHRLDDAFGGKGGLVVLHIHGVGHQADLRPAYALQLVHRLFHMGGACGAGHTGDVKFLFQGKHILSEEGSAHGRPSAPPPKRRKFGAEQMRYTPLGWGIFSIALGEEVCQGLSWRFFEILCRRAPALREAEQGLSKFKIEGNEEAPHS